MRHLVTSALPYINGIKHLGNLAGSLLPADIHVRYLRSVGEEAIFICATDEHGTPAELGAASDGLDVRSYCNEQHALQAETYRRFDLSFDHFGRTSSDVNARNTQRLFEQLEAAGYIEQREIEQVYSPTDGRFLPDRYVEGTCPHCGGTARGDQCDVCSTTLDPTDLLDARSAISGATDLERRRTRHLFLRQSALIEPLGEWLESRRGWPAQVLAIARGWLALGLQDRCITRDLTWGVPVPRPGFEGKVFYVWFDAPIGYISATEEWCASHDADLDEWWNAEADVRHVQFLAKDNVPFHAITFPATLLGSDSGLKTVDVIKGVNWLFYEGGKFSTSRRRGVFLDQALELLPADCWRWWLAANCPESGDVDFTFERFASGVNTDLADKFGNLVSRILGFVANRCDGRVPTGGVPAQAEQSLATTLNEHLTALREHHAGAEIRKAADRVRAIWDVANAYVANEAPWTLAKTDPARAEVVTRTAVNLVRLSALVAAPFIPASARTVLTAICEPSVQWPEDIAKLLNQEVDVAIVRPAPLFPKIAPEWVAEQTKKFAGTA